VIFDRAQKLYEEVTKVDFELYNQISRLNINELQKVFERVYIVRSKLHYALYSKFFKILIRVLDKRSFPARLIKVEELVYNTLYRYLLNILYNLLTRAASIIECGGRSDNSEFNTIDRFVALIDEVQLTRFEELGAIAFKNMNGESSDKSRIVKLLQAFVKLVESRYIQIVRFLRDHPTYPKDRIIHMKMTTKRLKRTIRDVEKLIKNFFTENYGRHG
jgi:hypothetical protein